ncbi:RNA 2',3'-cyclic phosphodiesterase [Amycolatopsis sp. K13G38]|uniref:RNA 2',3'-cyclic phosphodiesterase n=1 Tax=Amycolatopsis acididurans TaxID=2724524 RepID=A0ABX1JFI4_9PSEU|nr:RNA 2',3'-cyclic phosphodiesterase [Amycolatopsis acididurans]NKQ57271.1 RNA 2',3'-cyclic phosphodiesterase [Amycolatopsis acididurans]
MRLFSAVLPPPAVAESGWRALAGVRADVPGPRWVRPQQWHVTLEFYGEADAAERSRWLGTELAGRPAPVLRLEGAGTFARILYLGVYGAGLTELATAAGAGRDRPYLPHVTVARTRGDVPPELPARLAGYVSETWTATEAVLMRSEPGEGGTRYSVIDRFPLASRPAGESPA